MASSKRRKTKNINAKGRSVYDDARHLQLFTKMTSSKQFRSLRGGELKVLIEIASRHNGYNNGRIGAGLTDLSDTLFMSKSTVQRALEGLEAFGFVKRIKMGRFSGRIASEWEVTFLPAKSGKPSNEWGQKKPRKDKRKSKAKNFEQELLESPEVKSAYINKINQRYQNETE